MGGAVGKQQTPRVDAAARKRVSQEPVRGSGSHAPEAACAEPAEPGKAASRPRGRQVRYDEFHSRLLMLELDRRSRAEVIRGRCVA
jgi:hypothetical protein